MTARVLRSGSVPGGQCSTSAAPRLSIATQQPHPSLDVGIPVLEVVVYNSTADVQGLVSTGTTLGSTAVHLNVPWEARKPISGPSRGHLSYEMGP